MDKATKALLEAQMSREEGKAKESFWTFFAGDSEEKWEKEKQELKRKQNQKDTERKKEREKYVKKYDNRKIGEQSREEELARGRGIGQGAEYVSLEEIKLRDAEKKKRAEERVKQREQMRRKYYIGKDNEVHMNVVKVDNNERGVNQGKHVQNDDKFQTDNGKCCLI